MITIISSTNRLESMTLVTAKVYQQILSAGAENVQLLSLEGHEVWDRGEQMKELEAKYLIPADKFVFIMPEYNASFPGILKVMIDNSDIKKCWWYKKAMLVGLSDGRAGNIRGIEHMTSILHYMKVHVLYNKLLLSKVKEEIDGTGKILKPVTEAAIQEQAADFLKF